MTEPHVVDRYRLAIANYLSVPEDRVNVFWKGRVALFTILRAMGIKAGDEVIIPAYTCVVVPNAIIYLGAVPVYTEIDPGTYNMDIERLEAYITSKTRVIIAQNTYGLSPDIDAIHAVASKHGLMVVEDSAHGLGGYYKRRKNGTLTEAAFFSTQWNKPISTGLGGIAIAKHPELARKIADVAARLVTPSVRDKLGLRLLLWARDALITPSTYKISVGTYRWLSRYNLVAGSSQGKEIEGTNLPSHFLKGLSDMQAGYGIRGLAKLDHHVQHQQQVADRYSELLTRLDIGRPIVPDYAIHTFLRYPLRVRNRSAFIKKALRHKVILGDWFNSPIHPIQQHYRRWHYRWGTNPIAEKISMQVVNLPTVMEVNDTYLSRIENFLIKERGQIIGC